MVVTLDEIKLHCRIDYDQDLDDSLLLLYEGAARRHTENVLQSAPLDESADDNVKAAVLFLIAHWYRTREAVVIGATPAAIPFGYDALLFPEKHFLTY